MARRCLGRLLVLLLNVSHELGGTGDTGLWDAVFATFVSFPWKRFFFFKVSGRIGPFQSFLWWKISEAEHRTFYF